ncbi:poly(ADP-ribosyl)transferase [Tieghemostelium lacteum]|uniref:Poly [ADP-ribose] polymerase n=1 Tax=Tieghemostelium lacteum TaxID=361077 RepID=A0A151ZGJ0_TIELA|nr:poly(ADP-ribosyl)transferase [Tieghemostelium lacteum]|eukprot:KYQ93045.1 poly(ADP-ribosyl)transferase [Tieghemostelium lacteum]
MTDKYKFSIEYAKSDRSSCKTCSKGINKAQLRVGKSQKSTKFDGWETSWHHVKCLMKHVPNFENLEQWEYLRWDDQVSIKEDYFGIKQTSTANDKKRQIYLNALWDVKDELEDSISTKGIKAILDHNKGKTEKVSPIIQLHTLADWLLKGRTDQCPTCKNYDIYFNGVKYVCKGWATSFTKCDYETDTDHPRKKLLTPSDLSGKDLTYIKGYKFTKDYPKETIKYKVAGQEDDEEMEDEEEEEDDDREEDEPPAGLELYGMTIVIGGTAKSLGTAPKELRELIEEHGGEYTEKVGDANLMISCQDDVSAKKPTKKITDAINEIPIFPISWLNQITQRTGKGILLRKKEVSKEYLLEPSEFNDDIILAEKYFVPKPKTTTTTTSTNNKKRVLEEVKLKKEPVAGSQILKVDDQFSGGQIYVEYSPQFGYTAYNVMLNQIDMESGANRFYKLQIIKQGKQYITFLKWGRTGENKIGGTKDTPYKNVNDAIAEFAERFYYFTGNHWENRQSFVKLGGKYFMLDIDDGHNDEEEEDEEMKKKIEQKKLKLEQDGDKTVRKTTLPPRTQDLIRLMFDKEMMNKQMQSMNIDTTKMPLGKIKKSQLMEGYKILSEVQDELNKIKPSKAIISDCTNRFYSLIPHSGDLIMIDTEDKIKQKMQLVEALIDIDIANALAKEYEADISGASEVESHYNSLKTKIEPLDKNSEIYDILKNYYLNSHDQKYFDFKVEVEDIFSVEREGEKERFKPWDNNDNRQLLWHGSRLTNWVGIIGQGLRIAPPEAPKTGYRFGKGCYFANCSSKSASYCFTTRENPKAIMILCEVALGKMNELEHDKYMEKAPTGTHSTKALGMSVPDPKSNIKIENDIMVPCGKIIKNSLKTSCSHDELIVYDVAQIKIRYMFRVNIKN